MMHYDCSDEMMNGDTKLCTLDALNLFANLTNYWRRTCVEIGVGKVQGIGGRKYARGVQGRSS